MSSLADLAQVQLAEPQAELLENAGGKAVGDRMWRERKLAEARDLLALMSLAPRMTVKDLSLTNDLRALVRLAMPVPCRFGSGDLVIAHEALLGIRYPREVLVRSLPGAAFVQVLLPQGVFHSSVSEGPIQSLCLGAQLPLGIRVTELVLMSYRALAMQEHTLDVRDPAGIFRADAARWWQRNTERIPLTEEPFLARPPEDEVAHD
ncbi:MAG: hypothetical protein ACYTKC_17115 [Planctomycetota bacterium]|jgi:hypothetical protein